MADGGWRMADGGWRMADGGWRMADGNSAVRHLYSAICHLPFAIYSHYVYNRRVYSQDEIDSLLPLPPATFHILVALSDGERHGYAIIQDVEASTDGELRLSAGTLYRSIARMVEQGLIAETTKKSSRRDDDQRRRYYHITAFGTAVARAEMRRLTRLVRLGRASGLTPENA
jgi:DNA-binding PadR family transcriptional regulator